jgi:4'-phosphopantetheinyl transferase
MKESFNKTSLFDHLQTEVHVWFFRTDVALSDEQLTICRSQLSSEEMQRYQRFFYEQDKQNYLVSHVLLRNVLSKYADVQPSRWSFTCNQLGKPEIEKRQGLPEIEFNITHTKGLCACVIAMHTQVGVDAENISRQCDYKKLAQRMFAKDENILLASSGEPAVQFYKFWTLREAYVKALGTGLSGSSKEFYFTLSENDGGIAIHHKDNSEVDADCQFALYEPTEEHVLSVAIKKKNNAPAQMKQVIINEVLSVLE